MPISISALTDKVGEVLRQQTGNPQPAALEEIQRLVHDIEVYQAELENENQELKKSQKHLKAYRDRYVDLYDFAPVGYVTLDHEGYVQEINLAGAKLLGAERDALIGYAFDEYVVKEDREALLNHVRQCAAERHEVTSQLRLVSKGGQSITAHFHSIPIEGPADETLCKTAVTDITDLRRAEEALKEEREALRDSENELRLIMDSVPTLIALVDLECRYRRVNETYERWLSLPRDEIEGRHMREVLGEPIWQAIRPHAEQAMAGAIVTFEEELPLQHEPRWLHATYTPERDEAGNVCGFVVHTADIGDRKRLEERLQQAKADAERANQAKSRLLAYVSHDLRTPANAILGLVDLALARTTDATGRDFLQTAKDSADVLLTLLNDLVDSGRIEAGNLELEAVPFSLHRVLDRAARVLSVRASQKGVVFSCDVAADVPDWLVGDQIRLRQILLNLVENGIKFTKDGTVTLGVRVHSLDADEAGLAFAVGTMGPGIRPTDLAGAFQEFRTADPSTVRRFKGNGLGLAVAASLVSAMNGRIWVDSPIPHGAAFHFTIRLPRAKELPIQSESSREASAGRTSTLRILLVEDNPAHQKFVAYVLRDRGHTVEIAGNGLQALRLAEENRYDAILMDVEMPGMDGLEVTAAIRAREQQETHVPIIAITAHAMKGDRQRCCDAGMDGYLSKPIDVRQMTALVEELAGVSSAPAEAGAATSVPRSEKTSVADLDVFDEAAAIRLCFGRQEMFQTMVRSFFDDVDKLLPEMRAALARGDLTRLGELGHRLKGTVAYLGARRATAAALRVEQLGRQGGRASDAEEVVDLLYSECDALASQLPRL